MIRRYRLARPSRYVPFLAAGVALLFLIPGGDPNGDGPEAASDTPVLAVAATPEQQPAEPSVPPAKQRLRVASLPDDTTLPDAPEPAPASAPAPDDSSLQQAMRSVEPATTTLPDPVDETAAPAEVEAVAEEAEPAAPPEQNYRLARVGATALNVRAGPSSSNQKLFVLRAGEAVRVAGIEDGWARVIRADGEEGWAFAKYLTGLSDRSTAAAATSAPREQTAAPAEAAAPPPATTNAAPPRTRYARIETHVEARAAPSGNAQRLFVLSPGSRVAIAEVRGRWVHVVMDDGVSGWVRFR